MSPWFAIGVLAVWIGSLAAVGYWQNHAGHIAEAASWQKRYNEEVTQAANQIKDLEDKSRVKEQVWSKKVADVSADYQRKLKNADNKYSAVNAGIGTGAYSLLDRTAVCPGPDPAPQVTGTAGGRNGAEGCKLSPEASRFLWNLLGDADRNTEQLQACQQIILRERE